MNNLWIQSNSALMNANAGPLTIEELRSALLEEGRISANALLTPLSGGVSSLVAIVEDQGKRWIAKTPLDQLTVDDEWFVDRSRGTNEAAVLEFLNGALGPVRTPRLLFFDRARTVFGEELFEGPPPTYKEVLFNGDGDPDIGSLLGQATAALHRLDAPTSLSDDEPRQLFDELRLDPYYRATAERCPELKDDLASLIDETLSVSRRCLTHGDLTPKNILIAGDFPVVLDWEVVHVGDGAFDLGTMTAHFVLKALRTNSAGGPRPLLEAARRFWLAYDGPVDRGRGFRHTGAVMLARLYGKSRVDYLNDAAERQRAHDVGARALAGDVDGFESLADLVHTTLNRLGSQ